MPRRSVAAMTIALQYTNVTVSDVDEAIAFYDTLGLQVVNDVASGKYRWVTLGTDAQPGLGIVISEPHAGRSKPDGDARHRARLGVRPRVPSIRPPAFHRMGRC